ncbi:MAG TPA: hypothetical protein PLG31_08180, partial [Spirochaetota bacterium]|nr:hypothetical protein [Spirochaetota bacterium]
MRINNGVLMILVAASLITACVNKQEKGPITISGKIDASAVSGSASGPTLVAVAKTDSIEAIERDPAVVLRDQGRNAGRLAVQFALYGAGCLLIGVALLDRRRRDLNP